MDPRGDLATTDGRLTVVFDGYCKACTTIVGWLTRHDRAGRLRYVPNQAPNALETYKLTRDEVQRAVWVIEPDGTRHEGAEAANLLLTTIGGFWGVLAKLYRSRVFRFLEDRFYHWFSRNRHHFGWMWRTVEFCERPGADCLPPWDAVGEARPAAALGGGGGPAAQADEVPAPPTSD